MFTSDTYFDTIKVIQKVLDRRGPRKQQPWDLSLAEEIAAALSNAGLLK